MGSTSTPAEAAVRKRRSTPSRPRHIGAVELHDGRALGWAEFGHPDGDPVLWFHGTPGARLQLHPEVDEVAVRHGFRVIGVERPGTGRSTDHRYRRVVDFVADIVRLTEVLGIERFAAVGLSGGGPYTLACAHELPDRVPVAVTLGGLGPVTGPDAVPSYTRMLRLGAPVLEAIRTPAGAVLRSVVSVAGASEAVAHVAYEVATRVIAAADRPALSDPAFRSMFIGDLVGAEVLGAVAHDLALFSREWGFRLADVSVPVIVVQGLADVIVPVSHGNHLAARIPGAEFVGVPGEGHFAGFSDIDMVLGRVRAAWRSGRLTAE